jgi:hypothetical protein
LPKRLIAPPNFNAAKVLVGQGGVNLRVKQVTTRIAPTDETLLGG